MLQLRFLDESLNSIDIANITLLASATNRVVANGTTIGWNYYVDNASDPPIAVFWPNSSDDTTKLDGAGDPITANDL